jgi:hypothetical protein
MRASSVVLAAVAVVATMASLGDASFVRGRGHKHINHEKNRQPIDHVYTDCQTADCKSSRISGNITELEGELGAGIKHVLRLRCDVSSGKPCKAAAVKAPLTKEEEEEIKNKLILDRMAKLSGDIKLKKLNAHVLTKWPQLLTAIKTAIKEYDVGVLRKAAKVVARRSSKEQTVLDDIATKLNVLAQQPAEASGPSGPEDEEDEDEDEDEGEAPDVKGLTLEERIKKLEKFGLKKMHQRIDQLKKDLLKGAASGPNGKLVETLPLKLRVKILRKKIKAKLMKRLRTMEKIQHDELLARVAHLEKMKQKVLGHSVEDPAKPGKFLSHRGPGDAEGGGSDNSEEDSTEPESKPGKGPAAEDNAKDGDASGPEDDGDNAGDSGASGASGPKVLDDSDNPVYKLTGKEPAPPTPKGCTNGCPGNKIVPPGQKPIWHRVAEMDHNSFPDIVDDADAKEKDHTITGDKYIDMDAPKKKPKTVVALDKIVEGAAVPEGMEKAKMKVISSDKAADANSWIQ